MALNRKVRLPDLPIFRKYSLALRQEFARPEDILQVLDESRRQIRAISGEGGRAGPDFPRPRPARSQSQQKSRQVPDDATEAIPAANVAAAPGKPSDSSGPAKKPASAKRPRKKAPPKPEFARQKGRKKEEDTSASEEERQFWGEERSPARVRGRRGKAASEKEGPGEVGIVRIGAEGKPVARGNGSADEGDD